MRSLSSSSGLPSKRFGRQHVCAPHTVTFDDHFSVRSDLVEHTLRGCSESGVAVPEFAPFLQIQKKPEAWGIKVRFIWKLWEYIADDLKGYAAAHFLDEDMAHACIVEPCGWHHASASVGRANARGELRQMRANMHVIVERYVKPWTKDIGTGLAVMLNAGHMAWLENARSVPAAEMCKASVYISHSWSEKFKDFAKTLQKALDPEAVAWVCSFALWQHGDIAGALSDLEQCPFAVAMLKSQRVLLVTDHTTDAVTRCWVVLEALFASKWKKDYDVSLQDDGNTELWRAVGKKLERLDVTHCHATQQKDKEAILRYAQESPGGIPALNATVRDVSRKAMDRAELMAAATSGDIQRLRHANSEELTTWRSIRERTTTHIAAAHSHVAAMLEILRLTNNAHLNLPDADMRTPLSVAVESGALASILALISLRANLESPSRSGLTPLHLAAAGKLPAVAEALLDARSSIEAQGTYQGRQGQRPLMVAALEGRTEIVRTLAVFRADVQATTPTGWTALHVAAWEGRTEAAAALITCKAQVNLPTQNRFARTALMLATKNGHPSVASLLLGARADCAYTSRQGSTCHSYALMAMSTYARQNSMRRLSGTGSRKRRRCDAIMEANLLVNGHSDRLCENSVALVRPATDRGSCSVRRRGSSGGKASVVVHEQSEPLHEDRAACVSRTVDRGQVAVRRRSRSSGGTVPFPSPLVVQGKTLMESIAEKKERWTIVAGVSPVSSSTQGFAKAGVAKEPDAQPAKRRRLRRLVSIPKDREFILPIRTKPDDEEKHVPSTVTEPSPMMRKSMGQLLACAPSALASALGRAAAAAEQLTR